MKKTETVLQRRNFMLGLGLGGLAAATALIAGKQAKAEDAPQEITAQRVKKGYQASEHVQRYYRSTRI